MILLLSNSGWKLCFIPSVCDLDFPHWIPPWTGFFDELVLVTIELIQFNKN